MILFLVCLMVSIFLHELGHLIAAKSCKCGVDVFSIGFGKPIFKKKINNTIYQICPLLLGGYCKLTDELITSQNPYAFTNLIYSKKLIITFAGCFMNCISGALCLYLGKLLQIPSLLYFGYLALILGISNALPIPALDGSYAILVWLEKIYGKLKGYSIMQKICKISFDIIMILNIITIVTIIVLKYHLY